MADVEFEPLHGDNEEDGEFMLERRKKESSAKKHKQKGGQLFQRKSVEKKDKTLVIDNSKALASSPTRSVGHFHHHHHHHSRQVEGLVGPGDIQFGSSPPSSDDVMQNSLSQSTGSIPQTVTNNPNQPTPWQRPLQLPLRPPQQSWTPVQNQPPAGMQPLQRRTLSQEKLTLLEKAKMMTPTATHNPGVLEGVIDNSDSRRGFQTPTFDASTKALTPPRVASPTDKGPFSQTQQPLSSPVERKVQRSDSWDPSVQREHAQREDNWADFSKSFDGSEILEEQISRRRQSQVSTISEGSEGSYVSEIDENDWRITDEQRSYYLAQFKKLQPNENGVIKGPQARDFFLKSNLPVEVLSRVWHLSDLNKDSALDLEEFCIAMHLVVAVKHDVELPSVLPSTLIPSQNVQATKREQQQQQQQQQQQIREESPADDERPHSPQQSLHNRNEQNWAKFEAEENKNKEEALRDEKSEEFERQNRQGDAKLVAEQDFSVNNVTPHVKHIHIASNDDQNVKNEDTKNHHHESTTEFITTDSNVNSNKTPGFQTQNSTGDSRSDSVESPMAKEPVTKKSSIGIARPRGMGATINLIDTMPGQLLPPPDGKKSRKIIPAQPNFSHSLSSPPTSPTTRFSSEFSREYREARNTNDVSKQDSDHTLQEAHMNSDIHSHQDLDSTDGFTIPALAQRTTDHVIASPVNEDGIVDKDTVESPEVFLRRSSSTRKGGRPRSYTADSRSSRESLVDVIPNRETKEFEVPPTPPPRKLRTHKRGSSLDLSKLFGSRSQQKLDDTENGPVGNSRLEALPPRIPTGEKKEEKRKTSAEIHIIPRPRPAPQHHNRSTSCDSAQVIAPPPKTSEGIVKDSRTPGYRKKPAPPKPSSATRTGRSKSLERAFENQQNDESTASDHKPRNLRGPLRKKRQREEIKAGIRVLKEKNASISILNSELQQELKEAIEERTKLELQLTKLKQLHE